MNEPSVNVYYHRKELVNQTLAEASQVSSKKTSVLLRNFSAAIPCAHLKI